MSLQNILAAVPTDAQSEIIKMDAFLKPLRPLKFKRTTDKRKINYVSPDYGISYAIFPLDPEPTQQFGWYFLYDKEAKKWYRKTDYFGETLAEIKKIDPESARRIFDAINDCASCKGNPCSAIPYAHEGAQKLACYGRIVLRLRRDDFNDVQAFFRHLNMLVEEKIE